MRGGAGVCTGRAGERTKRARGGPVWWERKETGWARSEGVGRGWAAREGWAAGPRGAA